MLLTRVFSEEQFARALDSWTWIGLEEKKPVLASLFGDVFLASPEGWWFLDLMEGSLTHRWSDRDAVQRELDTEDGQDRYLLGGLAMSADARGMTLGPNEVYMFSIPPVIGGETTVENVQTMNFDVALTILGQLHHQVRDLPPGTPISGFKVEPEASAPLVRGHSGTLAQPSVTTPDGGLLHELLLDDPSGQRVERAEQGLH